MSGVPRTYKGNTRTALEISNNTNALTCSRLLNLLVEQQ